MPSGGVVAERMSNASRSSRTTTACPVSPANATHRSPAGPASSTAYDGACPRVENVTTSATGPLLTVGGTKDVLLGDVVKVG